MTTDGQQRTLDALRRIVRAIRVSSRASERTVGMSTAQLFVLRELALAGTCSIGELAARTLTHPSSVSTVVSRLVAQGLVERTESAGDRRRADVSCTVAGHGRLVDAPPLVQDRLIEALGKMDLAALDALANGLDLLAESVNGGEQHEAADMFFEEDASKTMGPKART